MARPIMQYFNDIGIFKRRGQNPNIMQYMINRRIARIKGCLASCTD